MLRRATAKTEFPQSRVLHQVVLRVSHLSNDASSGDSRRQIDEKMDTYPTLIYWRSLLKNFLYYLLFRHLQVYSQPKKRGYSHSAFLEDLFSILPYKSLV